ncbi:MAG TPA: DUF3105 domain-containing protein [Acidimicrobiales bacterium]|nr:DUF3105 domain-containing protein [Acidimicrobiales bacterium]
MLRRLTLALSVSTLLISLAACSGDAGGDPSGPSSEGEARTTSGGEPIGPADEGIEGVEAFRVDSHAHTEENLTYEPAPPTGGEHYPVPATCGFYESDPPPDELLVHDLEHGAVWIAYDPDLDDAQKSALSTLVAQQAKVTATPYPDLDSPLVVTAWARQLRLDSVDDPRLLQFIEIYRNSSNAPEPNAACQGIGTPTVASPAA